MNAFKKCPACASSEIKVETGEHHFLESGLDNVWLLNVEKLICSKCKEEIVSIPHSTRLMQRIAEEIITSPSALRGAEIRFVRKNLHLKVVEFARLLGVDRVTVSRWENGHESPTKPADRLIRFIYSRRARVSEATLHRLDEYLEKEEHPAHSPNYVIPLPLEQASCTNG